MSALYNEIDGFAAAWLRNLVAAGHIADGTVDQRSIQELAPDDCTATQCHFFAGIAGWSRALRLAGWPDDVPVWTGSCPCQPFSGAGTQRGFDDERHLWPDWFRLIRECRPPVIFGEQVAGAVAASWLDAVFDDLEGVGYACWAAVLPACSVGAFHRRYRIYFVAHRLGAGLVLGPQGEGARERGRARCVADEPVVAGAASGVAESVGGGREESDVSVRQPRQDKTKAVQRGPSYWSSADWVPCADGKSRPVEPGTFPLAHGVPGRMGRLRAYGNSIVPQVAAEFIRLAMEEFTRTDAAWRSRNLLSAPGHETQSVMHSPQSQAGGGLFPAE